MSERCVMCGVMIPEGNQVCPVCVSKVRSSINPDKRLEELIDKIELILIIEGQHDLKFKLGEIIKYNSHEVKEILLKHKEGAFGFCVASGGVQLKQKGK